VTLAKAIVIFATCVPLYRNFKLLESIDILKELGELLAMIWATCETDP
jgi:hypothetical protein